VVLIVVQGLGLKRREAVIRRHVVGERGQH
jgi:hypothetical protein